MCLSPQVDPSSEVLQREKKRLKKLVDGAKKALLQVGPISSCFVLGDCTTALFRVS